MKKIVSLLGIIFFCVTSFAQKQTYDVLTFNPPKGWQQQQNEGGLQLSITGNSGVYAIAVITKATGTGGSANENFNSDWVKLVKGSVQADGEPAMQPPVNKNGWEIISGAANYTDGANRGAVTLLTATGNGQSASVVLMTNTQQYQSDLLAFVNSVELPKISPGKINNTNPGITNNATNTSIVGLWADYTLEKNVYQQSTTGYLRKEYNLKPDGTYTYRKKNFQSNSTEIYFMYETGTYSINGKQLTITPKYGKTQFWSKPKSTKNNEWGSLVKSVNHKLEKVIYSFEILEDPNYGNSIIFKPGKSTTRDGGQFNAPDDPNEFHYAFRKLESLIDNPPGFKKETEGLANSIKPDQPASTSVPVATQTANAPAVGITGTWSQSSSSGAYGQSLSNGYTTMQYTFNSVGTYQYVAKTFSQNLNYIIFSKENGKYSIAGNKLTITPTNGVTQSWTKKKGNADQPGKLIKSEKWPLEKADYTFTTYYFAGIKESNLVLQNDEETLRDGRHSTNTLFQNAWYYKPISTANPKIELP